MKVPEHPAQERITLQHIAEVILSQFNLERGFLIFEQSWQPGIIKTLLTYFLAQMLYGLGIIGVILLTALFL